jgi:Uma2 family endonuclease
MAMPSLAERQHYFTFEDYVEIAERSPSRVELWEGLILDMSGGSPRHSAICNNIGSILRVQLRGKPCRAFDSNLRVRSLAGNRTTYADVTVVCGPLEIDSNDRAKQTVLNPAVLIEVLSPSTETDDKGAKLSCYQLIPSVRAVILVAQHTQELVVHERQADGSWRIATYTSGELAVPGVDGRLPVAEVYEDLPED